MRKMLIAILLVAIATIATITHAQVRSIYSCGSIGAFTTGHWTPLVDAPHDGTVVEVLNTYGIAPTYGLFKFDKDWGTWKGVDLKSKGFGLMSEQCMFYRSYSGDIAKYVDPTNGAQYTVKYECDAMHVGYNKKTDTCRSW